MAEVSLQNLTKIYDGDITAVNNITLEVADREFMVIVGPSGCGKTTILRMIAGLETATSGTISISNRIVNDIPPKDRNVAMVFQNYALYPHMNVFENMAFALKLRKYPEDRTRKKVQDTARLLGIEDILKRKPKALSGGQRQRVALGRAIVREPDLFLFDEPLSNLDSTVRTTTRAELKTLHQQLNTTSIYVTHDQVEAMTLADRICVLYKGRIQQVASPPEIYKKPANRFVAGFFGTLPMNFFDGLICYQEDKVSFVVDSSTILLPYHTGKRLAAYRDKQMVLGIRSEHLSVKPVGGQVQNCIECLVKATEPLGSCTNIYLRSDSDKELIASIESESRIKINQPAKIYLDPEKLYIFEPGEAGKNVIS
jgi:multiple sugar transport system ATP-binding protein